MSDSHIFLKEGVPLARVLSVSIVQPIELSPEMEATLGVESQPEPLSVAARQETLWEKLNLDGQLVPRECGGSDRASPGLS